MKVAVIGAGAAGFFAAINCAEISSSNEVFLFEKSNKVLAKVRVSGGGRCNVTHAQFDNSQLIDFYPRGKKELRNAFARFSTADTVKWFESRGVKLKTENDGRMFPVSDNSETIIHCLKYQSELFNVKLRINHGVEQIINNSGSSFNLVFQNGEQSVFDRVIITTGGNPQTHGYNWLRDIGHSVIDPVPSLFTFNIPGSPLKGLEGISSPSVKIKLEGSGIESTGPVLITHWGISGPGVLKLSSFAARWMHEKKYTVNCFLNWIPELKEDEIREEIFLVKKKSPDKQLSAIAFHNISSRLWQRLCILSEIELTDRCRDINNNKLNKLVHICCNMKLPIKGKTTFKEEFVTCGGISLKEIDMQTMESLKVKGMYFAGEVLDIDGVTGGFNFQAAWTTGFLAGLNAGK